MTCVKCAAEIRQQCAGREKRCYVCGNETFPNSVDQTRPAIQTVKVAVVAAGVVGVAVGLWHWLHGSSSA